MDMAKSTNVSVGASVSNIKKGSAVRIVVARLLIIIFVDVLVSSMFDFVRAEASREYSFYFSVLPILKIVFGVLLAASAAYLVITLVKKIDTSAYYITPAMITAVCLYLFVTAMFYNQFRVSPFLFYTMTVIVSVLFAVYYIYTLLLYRK